MSVNIDKVISVGVANLKKLGYNSLEEWLKDPSHVYIGRDMSYRIKGANKSKWANPFSAKTYGRVLALQKYREYLLENDKLMSELTELKGKTLGCWCRILKDSIPSRDRTLTSSVNEEICHGDILVELLAKK
jgi:hypothetical protein